MEQNYLDRLIAISKDPHVVFRTKQKNTPTTRAHDQPIIQEVNFLEREGYIVKLENDNFKLTEKGYKMSKYNSWNEYLESTNETSELKNLERKLKKLQIEEAEYKKEIREQEDRIRYLNERILKFDDKENDNKKKANRWKVIWAVIGFIAGAIVSNLELILNLLNIKTQQ